MGKRLRTIEAAVELLGALALIVVTRIGTSGVHHDALAVGFASGFLYRHIQASRIGGGFMAAPLRNLLLALAWTPLCIAVDRSIDDRAGRWSFAAGMNLGSAAHWLACRE